MLKWVLAALGAILFLAAAGIAFLLSTGLRTAHPVGFQLVSVANSKGPPLSVAIWYPASASTRPMLLGMNVQFVASGAPIIGSRLPLVVISHGTGGGPTSHMDTALALADAGFVVAAPMHTGDNYQDQSAVGKATWFVNRSRDVVATVDYMLKTWPGRDRIAPGRIGIFGFSAGGTTALIAVGGVPDAARFTQHCAKSPEFACQLWKEKGKALPAPEMFAHDPRFKAAVVAAPGIGFAFVPDGLKEVHVPVQLWNGDADTSVPVASNAQPVREALGGKAEFHLVPGAGHFAFLVPCAPLGPAYLCRDAKGFDRKAFHKEFDGAVVSFFKAKL